jgi:hypothetical protein
MVYFTMSEYLFEIEAYGERSGLKAKVYASDFNAAKSKILKDSNSNNNDFKSFELITMTEQNPLQTEEQSER